MNNTKIQGLQKPNIFNCLLEPILNITDCPKVTSSIKKINPQEIGDGHPVIIIPGFVKGRRSVNRLRKFLKKNNYQSQVWQLNREVGNSKNFHRLSQAIEATYEMTKESISIIGWSLGGYYARLLAKKHPEKIRQIITLNSPFNGGKVTDNAYWWFSLIYGGTKVGDLNKNWFYKLSEPIEVPSTAFFSKDDTLVEWKTCMEAEENEVAQNIEIKGSHVGVVFNQKVLPIILDRLQLSKDNWTRYEIEKKEEIAVLN